MFPNLPTILVKDVLVALSSMFDIDVVMFAVAIPHIRLSLFF